MLQGLSITLIRMTVECLGCGKTDDAAVDEWKATYSNLRTTAVQIHARTPQEPLLFWVFVHIDLRLWGCAYQRLSDPVVKYFEGFELNEDQVEMVREMGDYFMLMPRSKMNYDEDLDAIVNHTSWKISLACTPFDDHAGPLFSGPCAGVGSMELL